MDEGKRTAIVITPNTLTRILIVGLSIAALFYLRDIVLIFLTSVVIAVAIEPGTQWLVRRRIPRVAAVVIIYAIIVIAIIAFFYFALPLFLNEFSDFVKILPGYIQNLNIKTGNLGGDLFNIQTAVKGISAGKSLDQAAQNLISTLSAASSSILDTVTAVFGGVVSFMLIMVISFYLSVQEKGIEEFLRLVSPLKHEQYIISLWNRTQQKIGKWLQGQVVLILLVGMLVYTALSILGIPNALLLALIATLLEIIPVFGPIIASVPAILIGFVHGGFTLGLIVALAYVIIQQIESSVIYPLVMRKVLNVQPLIVIVALIVGARLGGFLGIILSVPIATALMEYLHDVGKNRDVAREKFNSEAL